MPGLCLRLIHLVVTDLLAGLVISQSIAKGTIDDIGFDAQS